MSFSVYFKIVVALEIIGKETHAALISHHFCAHRKELHLFWRKAACTALEKSLHIDFKQFHTAGYFTQIFFVFCCSAGSKPDRITEIIHSKPRHYRIQVDDADSFSCNIVNHNIVKLCIIVGHSERQLAFILKFSKDIGSLLVSKDKFNFLSHRFRSAADILFNSIFKHLESCPCVVEPFNSFMKGGRRIICKKSLEVSKCNCTLVKVFGFFYPVITCCICDKFVGPPVFSFGIHKISFSVLCRDDIKGLSLRISSPLNNLFPEVRCHSHNIFHELHRFCKNFPVHSLKDSAHSPHIADFECEQVGVIDMPASKKTAFL